MLKATPSPGVFHSSTPAMKGYPPWWAGGLNADALRHQFNATPPLGGGSAADHSRHVSVNSSPTITVHGVSDPTAAAGQIGARLDKHQSTLLRNMQSAIR